MNVEVKNNNPNLVVKIKALENKLDEVVVKKTRSKVFSMNTLKDVEETAIYAGKKTEVVSLEQISANKAINNPRQIFAQVAGLNIFESNDGGLQLNIGGRGLDPNRTSNFNTRQNGYDISADVLGYPESYYTPPTEGLKEIQVIRGAASLQYGTQFGGLINFKMKTPNPDKKIDFVNRNTIGSYNLFTNFSSLSGTVGKFSYYTFYNFKKGDGFRPNSEFESKNYFGNFNYQFNSNTSLHFDYTHLNYLAHQPGGLTDKMFYENPLQSNRTRNWFAVNWNLFSLTLKHNFNNNSNCSLQFFGLSAQRNTIGFRTNRVSQSDELGTVRDLILGDFQNWGSEGRYIKRYNFLKKQSALLVGFKYYQSNNKAIQGPGSSGSDADFKLRLDQFPGYHSQSYYAFPNQNVAFFGENLFRISERFSVTPGVRFEHITTKGIGYYKKINFDNAGNVIFEQKVDENRELNRNFVLLGVGLSYKPKDFVEFYGNISQNYRSVTFDNIRVNNPTLVIDENITDEKGYTSDVGLRGKLKSYVSYDINAFVVSYKNRIGEIDEVNGLRTYRRRGNIGDALIYGIDFFMDWKIIQTFNNQESDYKWNLFLNTSMTKSEYVSSKSKNVVGKQVEFVPLINLKSGTSFGYKNLNTNFQITYLSSQYSDASNAKIDRSDNTSGIKGEIPSYYVLDWSLNYKFSKFLIEAGVNNLTNNYYFTRRATGYPGPGILPSDNRIIYVTLQFNL